MVLTGSFDNTVTVWATTDGKCVFLHVVVHGLVVEFCTLFLLRRLYTLIGHRGEISNAVFNYSGSLIATASMDHTCKLWDASSGRIVATLRGHEDEVLDVCFDTTGQHLATASADGRGGNSLQWNLR